MGSRHRATQICPLTALQFIVSFQVTRDSPARVVATLLRLLCKLKGTLAWTGQPSANNPRLGETAPCSPGKHKHLLVTHSNQKWPTRRETSPQRQKRKQAALQLSFFLIHPLAVRGHKATTELLVEKCHWVGHWIVSTTIYHPNLTHRATQSHMMLISLSPERPPKVTQLWSPKSGNS